MAKFRAGSIPMTCDENFFFKILINEPSLLAISIILDFLFIPNFLSFNKKFVKILILLVDTPVSHK